MKKLSTHIMAFTFLVILISAFNTGQVLASHLVKVNKWAGATPTPIGDTNICTIRFKRAGNLILIEAQADSVKGDFILDTGAPYLVLNSTYFRDHTVTDSIQGVGINGGISSATKTVVNTFSIGPFKYRNINADMISLAHIEDMKGIKILGLIGLNLLLNYTISIDYANNLVQLKLIKPGDGFSFYGQRNLRTESVQTFNFRITEDKIITPGKMSGKKLNFIIDTGAETNLLDSRLPNNVLKGVHLLGRVNLSGSDTSKVEAINGNAGKIELGGVTVQDLPVTITNLQNMCDVCGCCIGGMLGYSFLSRQHVEINFASHKIYLWD